MKRLKGMDFVARTSSRVDTEALMSELKVRDTPSSPNSAPKQCSVCDHVLRACIHWLGLSRDSPAHVSSLLCLADLACQGFIAARLQPVPFYLEKILYHLLRSVAAQGAHEACQRFAGYLYSSLLGCRPLEASLDIYTDLAKSCSSVLWKAADGVAESGRRAVLSAQLQAVRFLVLLEHEGSLLSPLELPFFISQAARQAAAAALVFETKKSLLTKDDACFLSEQISCHLVAALLEGRSTATEPLPFQRALCLFELTLEQCRHLCRSGCFEEGKEALQQCQENLQGGKSLQQGFEAALDLLRAGVELSQLLALGKDQVRVPLCQAAAALRSSLEVQDPLCRVLGGSCQFIVSSLNAYTKRSQRRPFELKEVLSLFAFMECYCRLLCKLLDYVSKGLGPLNGRQKLPLGKVEGTAEVAQLAESCCKVVIWMLEVLEGVSEQEKAEYLAQHRCFKLQVENYRKLGRFEEGLRSIVLWLVALRGKMAEQMAEPISLWVKVKMDASKSGGDDDLRLRTLKDGLEGHILDPETLVVVLSEELKTYKGVRADTGQERFNVICDLLELCSEESGRVYERAVTLVELAQVLCYHDYMEQTSCSALDSIQEALRLLDSVPPSPQNEERLQDSKAQALLWLYICSVELKMCESIERDQRARALGQKNLEEFEPNDLNYEEKAQEDRFLYDGISFNLAAESVQSKSLDDALDLWKNLLAKGEIPVTQSIEQTTVSLHIVAAFYRMMAKPLQSLESYLLIRTVSSALGDWLGTANALCQATKLLFLLECPSYAEVLLQEAESCLQQADSSSDSYLLLKQTCLLLRSQLCCANHKVEEGLALLLEILQNPALQKNTKVWYLLRGNALQVMAAYLLVSLALTCTLPGAGWRTPETALTDAHKIFRSIMTLVMGGDVLLSKGAAENPAPFADYGDNLLQKWLVLADLLSCMETLVRLLGKVETVCEAKAFCLEALKLSMRLQTIRWCVTFLVLKGELELQRSEQELCHLDLQQALFLLESGTGEFSLPLSEMIKPRKGRSKDKKPRNASLEPAAEEEPFLKGPSLEFVDTVGGQKESALTTSPVLKQKEKKRLSFLSHAPGCRCCLCSDVALAAICLHWLVASAHGELALGNQVEGLSLLEAVLRRCASVASRFTAAVRSVFQGDGKKGALQASPSVRLLDGLVARLYASLAAHSISSQQPEKKLWELLETGLSFLSSKAPRLTNLEHQRASLLLTKAVATIYMLASKHGGCMANVFSGSWGWKPALPVPKTKPARGQGVRPPPLTDPNDVFAMGDPDAEVPSIVIRPVVEPCTPVQKSFPNPKTHSQGTKLAAAHKASFMVFNEASPQQAKPELPKAPKASRKTKSRLKVMFSDESEPEDPVVAAHGTKLPAATEPEPASRKVTRAVASRRKVSKSVVEPEGAHHSSSDDCSQVGKVRPPRGRQSRRRAAGPERTPREEETELLRTIEEEEGFEISFEAFRGSDEEEPEREVLTMSNVLLADISSLESVYDSLQAAFHSISHCPPSTLYRHLCQLMALCVGSRDPVKTAYLVSESVSVTLRHQLMSSVHRRHHKMKKKPAADVTEQLKALDIEDRSNESQGQYLSRLQSLFQFSVAGPGQLEVESFKAQLEQIPKGIAVCLLTLVSIQPGAIGDTLLLTRLESGTAPVTIQIPMKHAKMTLSSALVEFDAIQKEQKEITNCTDRKEWWLGRTELDRRMKVLTESLEKDVLSCWRGALLPAWEGPSLAAEASCLQGRLRECGGEEVDLALLKAMLTGAHLLTHQDTQCLVAGLGLAQPEKAQALLQEAVDKVKSCAEKSFGHLVLVLDKHLQKFPWESMPCLRALSVTRLPSLRFLYSYSLLQQVRAASVLARGVDPSSAFYILNPHNNLPGTEAHFRSWFESESGWTGVVGEAPGAEQIQAALVERDLYIYAGHGSGARFLDGHTILKLDCRAVALLFGCSSAALAVRGNLEGAGLILKFIMAGCPLVLGNLWDVTDRDIDRYMEALLQSWLKAGARAPLLQYVAQSRKAPKLKYLIGAAPIVYGLPVSLQEGSSCL
uniref:separase n=1 Tax=Sphenodon punctatus TaxID=8508 RepID=A0A8D0HRW4_SPHPU